MLVWSSLLQETFLRRYMFREFISKKRNLFVRISSLYADRWTYGFSTIIIEGASVRSNIINYCMWSSCVYLIYNYILLEISGSHSNFISDNYVFHYGNELVSRTGNKEIRHFVTTNFDQKYPFAYCLWLYLQFSVSVRSQENEVIQSSQ